MSRWRLNNPDIEAFQARELDRLLQLSHAELSALPERARVPTPAELRGVEFWIRRRPGEAGGVEVEVCACIRTWIFFMGCSCPRFERLSDGRLVEDEPLDPED